MGFYPFLPQSVPAGGGTFTGAITTVGITNSTTAISSSANIATTGLASIQAGGNLNSALGSLDIQTAGQGLKVKEGSNAKQGTFTLAGAATTVVANTSVTANSRIFMQTATLGTVTAASTLAYTVSAGTSFTVTPSQSTDTSTINFEIFEPG